MLDTLWQGRAYFQTHCGASKHTLIVITDPRTLPSVGDVGHKYDKGLISAGLSVAQLLERVI